jgi:hypothetical protein
MMQDKISVTCHWVTCSGWGREHHSGVFSKKGSRFIRKRTWCTKVNILQLAVGYLNSTTNRKTRNPEPEVATDGCSEMVRNQQVDWYRSWFGPPWHSRLGFWTVLKQNQTVLEVWIRTAGRLPGPVGNTIHSHPSWWASGSRAYSWLLWKWMLWFVPWYTGTTFESAAHSFYPPETTTVCTNKGTE